MMKKRKALGLLALVLGLMVTAISSAQAETGAKWTILKNDGTTQVDAATLMAMVEIKELEGSSGELSTSIGGTSVRISCTGAQLIGAKLEGNGSITSGFKAKFTGCGTFLNNTLSPLCLPLTGTSKDEIVTNPLKGLIVLHLLTPGGSVATIVRIEPVTGEKLADIVLGSGGTCFLEKIPILGKFTLKDTFLSTLGAEHLVFEGLLTEMWAVSKTEEHRAKIVGAARTRLTGMEHETLHWKGEPNLNTKP
jgi:hypothetical protein